MGLQFLLQGLPGIMVKPLSDAFNISLTQVGVLSSSMIYLYIILQAPAGKIASFYGEKFCLVIASGSLAVLCLLFTVVSTYTSAVIIRMLMGVAAAPGVVCVMLLISRWFSARSFAFIAGVWEAVNMVIAASGPVFMSKVVNTHGWKTVLLLIAGICVVVLIMNVLIVTNAPEGYEAEKDDMPEEKTEESGGWQAKNPFFRLIKNVSFVSNCVFILGLFSVVNVFASLWGIPFMRAAYPEHSLEATQAISFVFIGLAIGAPLTGAIASYINRLRLIMFWCALITLLCLTVLFYYPVSFKVAGGILFILGVSASAYMLPFSAIRRDIPPALLYLANAILNAASLLAAPLFQPLIGKILDLHSQHAVQLTMENFQVALLPLYIIVCVAIFSLIWIKENKMYSQ
ncbi:MAG: MFS transporter [Endozoicomonadaceae bacterium]|nr:MFS transporter [Endozoicomonadaceae bacterium]MCY4329760.1 MFS transporter [Endozoicomonadaceae bacterium]